MSRVGTLVREDLRHTLRSRLVWGAVVLLAVMVLPSTPASARPSIHPLPELLALTTLELTTFALVVVAAVGVTAVVGEARRGTMRLVLGLPGTRRDLVLAKLVARSAVVTLAIGAVLAVYAAIVVARYGTGALGPTLVMVGWTVVYGVVWTAVVVGYSAAFASQFRALGALVLTYATFSPAVGLWGLVADPVFALLVTGSSSEPAYETLAAAPTWVGVTQRLNPLRAYYETVRWSVEHLAGTRPADALPLVAFGAVVFLGFGASALWVGLRRFEGRDLGGGRDRGLLASIGSRLAAVRPGLAGTPVAPSDRPTWLRLASADARRALGNWVVLGALGLVFVLVGPDLWYGVDPTDITGLTRDLADLPNAFALPVLVMGVALGYGAVAGERERGTDRFVLGVAVRRRDLVLGALASRVSLAVLTVLPLVCLAAAFVWVRYGTVRPVATLAWGGWVLGWAALWTAFVVGASAAVTTRFRSLAVVFGTFLAGNQQFGLWDPVVRRPVTFLVTGTTALPAGARGNTNLGPVWFRYLDHLNPFVALSRVQRVLLSAADLQEGFATAPLAVYSVLVCLAFGAIPVAIGLRRYERRDLP